MDEELAVYVQAVLDEEKSYEKFGEDILQLANKINQSSPLDLVVGVDVAASASVIKQQLQKLASELGGSITFNTEFNGQQIVQEAKLAADKVRNVITAGDYTIDIKIDKSGLEQARVALKNANLSDSAVDRMTEKMGGILTQVDKVSGSWQEAGDSAQRFLNLTVVGTNDLGQTVKMAQTFDAETGEIDSHIVSITDNIKQQRVEQKAALELEQKRLAAVSKATAKANELKAAYSGDTSARPLTDTKNIAEADRKYNELVSAIEAVKNTSGAYTTEQQTEIQRLTSELDLLIKKYQNLEYIGVQLRRKTVSQVKVEQGNNLDEYAESIKRAGLLTGDFNNRVNLLKDGLKNVTDRTGLTAWLDGFSGLKTEVSAFQAKVKTAEATMTKVIQLNNKIASATVKVDGSTTLDSRAANEETLALLKAQRLELESNLTTEEEILSATKNRTAYLDSQVMAQNRVTAATAEREAKESVSNEKFLNSQQEMLASLNAQEDKWRSQGVLTDEVKQKVAELRQALTDAFDNTGLDEYSSKLSILKSEITSTKATTANVNSVVTSDTLSTKIETARSKILNLRQTYSAFVTDSQLMKEWQNLFDASGSIKTQKELTNLNAKIDLFKQKIVGAGKDGKNAFGSLVDSMRKMAGYMVIGAVVSKLVSGVKGLYSAVMDLDSAMVELKKVTDETEESYDAFLSRAAQKSIEIGTSYSDFVDSTASFARLGYKMEDAEALAEVANVYYVVGDEISYVLDSCYTNRQLHYTI